MAGAVEVEPKVINFHVEVARVGLEPFEEVTLVEVDVFKAFVDVEFVDAAVGVGAEALGPEAPTVKCNANIAQTPFSNSFMLRMLVEN